VPTKSLQSKVQFQSDIASSTSCLETVGSGVLMAREVLSIEGETQVIQSMTELIELHLKFCQNFDIDPFGKI